MSSASSTEMTRIKRTNITLLVWFSIFFLLVGLISANVFVVVIGGQHVHSKTNIKEIADGVYIRQESILANRGLIVDRNNNVLAEDVVSYKIILYLDSSRVGIHNTPAYVVDKEATAAALAPLLNMEEQVILDHLNKDLYQTELGIRGRNLSLNTRNEILALGLPGIAFETMISRNYPQGVFASHLIGFSQFDDEVKAMTGRMGLEAIFNQTLLGENGWRRYQSDISGFRFKDMYYEEQPAINGNTLVLTLDRGIQETLELALENTMQTTNAYEAWGMVMEAKSGDVLGWANTPSFDPNAIDISSYDNVISQSVIEPGSTMKSFVYATVIDKGKYDGNATYPSGVFHMGIANGYPIRVNSFESASSSIYNAGRRDWGIVDFDRAYALSLNTAIATMLTSSIHVTDYEEYLDRFGFFKPVNMVGVYENEGQKAFRYPIEMLTSGYGQGSTVTTLQLMQAYSAIINDGVMVKPKVVDKIIDPITNEVVMEYPTEVVGQPIQASTAKEVQRLMRYTADAGTARHYQIPEVGIIGKTGTSQVIGPNGYYSDRNLFSVVIGLPADNPEILVYYAFLAPSYIESYNHTAPIQSVLRKIAMTYNYAQAQEPDEQTIGEDPTDQSETSVVLMPSFRNKPVSEFDTFVQENHFQAVILGEGDMIIDSSFEGIPQLINTTRLFVLTNKAPTTMIDLTGFSKKDVMTYAKLANINVELIGEGWVRSQSLEVNEPLSSEKVVVNFTLNEYNE